LLRVPVVQGELGVKTREAVTITAYRREGTTRRQLWAGLTRWRVRSAHVKFVIIGIYNTLFGYFAFAGLHLGFPQVNYMLILVISRELSVVSAFVAYRLLVFKVKGRLLADFGRFWLVYSGALILNLIALPFFVEIIGLNVLLAQAVTIVLTVVSTWIGHSHFSFKRAAEPAGAEPGPEAA
jgi:putative flippase GtrA